MYTCANIQMKSTIGQNILCSKSLQMFCGKCYILSGMSVQDLCDTFEHTLSLNSPFKQPECLSANETYWQPSVYQIS